MSGYNEREIRHQQNIIKKAYYTAAFSNSKKKVPKLATLLQSIRNNAEQHKSKTSEEKEQNKKDMERLIAQYNKLKG